MKSIGGTGPRQVSQALWQSPGLSLFRQTRELALQPLGVWQDGKRAVELLPRPGAKESSSLPWPAPSSFGEQEAPSQQDTTAIKGYLGWRVGHGRAASALPPQAPGSPVSPAPQDARELGEGLSLGRLSQGGSNLGPSPLELDTPKIVVGTPVSQISTPNSGPTTQAP